MNTQQTSAVVILRDQTEECPLHWVWSNIPEQSSELMIKLGPNWPNEISLGQMIPGRLELCYMGSQVVTPA